LNRLENILIGVDLKAGYTRLTKREKNIINLYYLEGYKDEEMRVFLAMEKVGQAPF
jgi:RNA polymerase sigma factor for flagellar operon FliA